MTIRIILSGSLYKYFDPLRNLLEANRTSLVTFSTSLDHMLLNTLPSVLNSMLVSHDLLSCNKTLIELQLC